MWCSVFGIGNGVATFYNSWQPAYELTVVHNLTMLEKSAVQLDSFASPACSSRFNSHGTVACGSTEALFALGHDLDLPASTSLAK